MQSYPKRPGSQGCNRIHGTFDQQIEHAMRSRSEVRSRNIISRLFEQHGPAIVAELLKRLKVEVRS